MKLIITKGKTSQLARLFIQDSSVATGAGLTGIAFNSATLTWYYIREGASSATQVTLATMTVGTWATGGFKEIDSTNMPGWYEIGIPDACLATGANSVAMHLKGVTNMAPVPVEIELTAFDLQTATQPVNTTQWNGINVSSPATAGIPDINVKNINNVSASSVTTINANQGTTQPVNFTGTGASALAKSDTVDIAGAAVSTSSAQIGVNAVNIGGTAQTGRDIGASVLLSAGTGTGQLDFTSGVVKANLAQILGTALTETAGLIAAGFKQFFNISSPTSTMNTITTVTTTTTATTATNLTNAPTAGDFTAAMKTSLNAATPAVTVSDKTGFSLSSAGVQAIWDALTSALTTVNSIGKLLATNVDALISSRTKPADTQAAVTLVTTTTTTTNLTNAPTSGDFTAAMKTSLNAATPAVTVSDKTGFSLSTAGIQAIWDRLTSALTTSGSVGKLLVDNIDATISSRTKPADTQAAVTLVTTTTNLTNAPTSGDLTAAMKTSVEDAAWDATLASHLNAGSTGAALNAAGSSGDPWNTALPGAYGAGSAGNIVGNNLNATVSSRSTLDGTGVQTALTSQGYTSTRAGYLDTLNGLVQAIWDKATSALTAVGSIGKRLVDDIDAAVSSRSTYAGGDTSGTTTLLTRIPGTVQPQTGDSYARLGAPAGASVSADIAAVNTNVLTRLPTSSYTAPDNADISAIKAKTDNLPAAPASTGDVTTVGSAIAVLNNISTAQVKTQVVAALVTDTYAEPSAVVGATASIKDMLNWLKTLGRNQLSQTDTTQTLFANDDSTPIATAGVSDDATTATRNKFS